MSASIDLMPRERFFVYLAYLSGGKLDIGLIRYALDRLGLRDVQAYDRHQLEAIEAEIQKVIQERLRTSSRPKAREYLDLMASAQRFVERHR